MDTAKDTGRRDAVTRFVGNQTTRTSPFGDNVSADRAYRKAEKIGAAIHLLTNHLPDSEHIRGESRRTATELLVQVLSLRDEMRSADSLRIRECNASIRYLISMLRLLAVSGHVSVQNADIVIEALDDLGAFVQSAHKTVLSESVRLSRDEFVDVRMRVDSVPTVTDTKKDIPQAISVSASVQPRSGGDEPLDEQLSDIQPVGDVRALNILEVLRAGGQWGIKDVAAHLPEYSEKMIQRELADLVHAGVIVKTGAKRWSRYAVKDLAQA